MVNSSATNHARSASSNALMVRGISHNQAELAIAQAIYELSKAVEEIARRQD